MRVSLTYVHSIWSIARANIPSRSSLNNELVNGDASQSIVKASRPVEYDLRGGRLGKNRGKWGKKPTKFAHTDKKATRRLSFRSGFARPITGWWPWSNNFSALFVYEWSPRGGAQAPLGGEATGPRPTPFHPHRDEGLGSSAAGRATGRNSWAGADGVYTYIIYVCMHVYLNMNGVYTGYTRSKHAKHPSSDRCLPIQLAYWCKCIGSLS